MRIEHGLHPEIYLKDDTSQGMNRKGLVVTDVLSGEPQIRDFSEKTRISYRCVLEDFDSDSDKLALYEAIMNQVGIAVDPLWVRMPITRKHGVELYCGPEGDGSRTAFPFPFQNETDHVITVADKFQLETTDYTLHPSANVMTADQASPFLSSLDGSIVNIGTSATIALQNMLAADGLQSYVVQPAAAAANHGVGTASGSRPTVEASTDYKAIAYVRGAFNFTINVQFYQSGGSTTGSLQTSTPVVAGVDDDWTAVELDVTSPADAASAAVYVNRTTSSALWYWVDCFGMIPGQLDVWYHPSVAPGVIEFASAVALGSRVKAKANGDQILRGLVLGRGTQWKLREEGVAYVNIFEIEEALE